MYAEAAAIVAAQQVGAVDEAEADGAGEKRERNKNGAENVIAARVQQNERVEVEQTEREAAQEEHQREREESERVEQCGRPAAERRRADLAAHLQVVILLLNGRFPEVGRAAGLQRVQTARIAVLQAVAARARCQQCGAT